MIFILGILDIITAILVLLHSYVTLLPLADGIIKFFAIVLLIKGGIFSFTGDIASIIDVVCALIILCSLMITISFTIINVIVAYLIIKGAFSLV